MQHSFSPKLRTPKLRIMLICGFLIFLGGPTMAAELKVGDTAPSFKLPGSDGKTHRLDDLTKKGKVVVLAWFPKAFTGG